MKPVAAARNIPMAKGIVLRGSLGVEAAEGQEAVPATSFRNEVKNAETPTIKLSNAANLIVPDSPSMRMTNSAAAREATPDPNVFTA